jgi:hypothetical protein
VADAKRSNEQKINSSCRELKKRGVHCARLNPPSSSINGVGLTTMNCDLPNILSLTTVDINPRAFAIALPFAKYNG